MKDQPTMKLGDPDTNMRAAHEEMGAAMHRAMPGLTAMRLQRRLHKAMANGNTNIVVDGVRHPKEAAVIRRMGGMMVRCDNGMEAASMPMDMMQRGVEQAYTLDTSGPSKKDRWAKADQMLRDCLP